MKEILTSQSYVAKCTWTCNSCRDLYFSELNQATAHFVLVIDELNTGISSLRTEYIPTSHPIIMPGTEAKSAPGLGKKSWHSGFNICWQKEKKHHPHLCQHLTWTSHNTTALKTKTWRQKPGFYPAWVERHTKHILCWNTLQRMLKSTGLST